MYKLGSFLGILFLVTGCSFKLPPGNYSTAPPPSSGVFAFAGEDLTLKENGRFQYRKWSDDGPPDIGHGGYIIIGNNLLLLFENSKTINSGYVLHEKECINQDTQIVNFKISEKRGKPLIGVSIYNIDDKTQGTVSQIDGSAQFTLIKEPKPKAFQFHYTGVEDIVVEFDGDKCFDIEIILKGKVDQLKRGDFKAAKLKREGDQLFIKLHTWKDYSKIHLREN